MVDAINLAAQDPGLPKAIPSEPEELYRLGRLAMRIYGLLCRDLEEVVNRWVAAASGVIKRKDRKETARQLVEELPVLLLIHVLDRINEQPFFAKSGVAELLRGLLVPCFSLEYRHLYDQSTDPVKQVLSRLDWYLDGDKTDMVGAFEHFSVTLVNDGLKDAAPLHQHLGEVILPEMDNRLDLAFRYEFL